MRVQEDAEFGSSGAQLFLEFGASEAASCHETCSLSRDEIGQIRVSVLEKARSEEIKKEDSGRRVETVDGTAHRLARLRLTLSFRTESAE